MKHLPLAFNFRTLPELILISFFLGFFMLGNSTPISAEKLRICIGDFPPYEIASEKFLRQPEFEITRTSLIACVRRFRAGNFDLTFTDSFVVASVFAHDETFRIISLVDASEGADMVLAKKQLDTSKLRGSMWALETNTLSSFLLSLYLGKFGVGLDEVTLTTVRAQNTPMALNSKRFTGIVTWPPYSMKAKKMGGHVLATSADFTQKGFDFVVTTAKSITTKKDLITRYLAARFQSANAMEEVYRNYALFSQSTPAEAKENFEGLKIYRSSDEVRAEKERAIESVLYSAKAHDIIMKTGDLYYQKNRERAANLIDFSLLP